jgi:hypothetical protein
LLKRLLKVLSARPVATGAVTLGLLGTSVGAGVTILAPSGGGGGAVLRNIWIDSNGGTCTRSASPVAYTAGDAASCSSISAAYTAASNTAGDTICLKPNSYGSQTLPRVAGKTTPNAVFDGCEGGVELLSLTVGADTSSTQPCCATFKDMAIAGSGAVSAVFIYWGSTSAASRAADLTFDNVDVGVGKATNGPLLSAFNVLRLTVKNSTFGPACCGNGADGTTTVGSPIGIRVGTADRVASGWPTNTDVVIDNNLIQGITRSCSQWLTGFGSCPQSTCINTGDLCHADAIQIYGSENLQVTDNRMYHNEVQGLFIDPTDPHGGTVVITNNMIGDVMDDTISDPDVGAVTGISLDGGAMTGTWTLAHNTIGSSEVIFLVNSHLLPGGFTMNVEGNVGNWSVSDNVVENTCIANTSGKFTFDWNVWGGQSGSATGCGGNETIGVPSFVNTALATANTMDLALSGAAGIADDNVPVANGCGTTVPLDINGTDRPVGTDCDSGAFER